MLEDVTSGGGPHLQGGEGRLLLLEQRQQAAERRLVQRRRLAVAFAVIGAIVAAAAAALEPVQPLLRPLGQGADASRQTRCGNDSGFRVSRLRASHCSNGKWSCCQCSGKPRVRTLGSHSSTTWTVESAAVHTHMCMSQHHSVRYLGSGGRQWGERVHITDAVGSSRCFGAIRRGWVIVRRPCGVSGAEPNCVSPARAKPGPEQSRAAHPRWRR